MVEAPLRVAIAGAGMVARLHLDAARRAGARVSASARPRRARKGGGRALRHRAGLRVGAGAGRRGRVDVVHICTPNSSHYPLADLALRSGKHVVCEKPLATSVQDAEALARTAQDSGLIGAVPFVYRYHPMAAEARARVQRGDLGPVRLVHGTTCRTGCPVRRTTTGGWIPG